MINKQIKRNFYNRNRKHAWFSCCHLYNC